MSQAALCDAVKAAIQAEFGFSDAECEVMLDGQPPPVAGEWFYAVHPGDVTGDHSDFTLGEQVAVMVTLTRRLGFSPEDAWGVKVWREQVEPATRRVVTAVHKSYATMQAANAAIVTPNDGFHEPLQMLRVSRPQVKGPEWFSSYEETEEQTAHAGVAVEIAFGRARREQPVENLS